MLPEMPKGFYSTNNVRESEFYIYSNEEIEQKIEIESEDVSDENS